jgi:hypothetical protein
MHVVASAHCAVRGDPSVVPPPQSGTIRSCGGAMLVVFPPPLGHKLGRPLGAAGPPGLVWRLFAWAPSAPGRGPGLVMHACQQQAVCWILPMLCLQRCCYAVCGCGTRFLADGEGVSWQPFAGPTHQGCVGHLLPASHLPPGDRGGLSGSGRSGAPQVLGVII